MNTPLGSTHRSVPSNAALLERDVWKDRKALANAFYGYLTPCTEEFNDPVAEGLWDNSFEILGIAIKPEDDLYEAACDYVSDLMDTLPQYLADQWHRLQELQQ